MKFLWERNMVKGSDELENGCVPVHYGVRMTI